MAKAVKKRAKKVSYVDPVPVYEKDWSPEAVPEGDELWDVAAPAVAVPHDYHAEALKVAGIDPDAAPPDWVEAVANVSHDGASGRLGTVAAHKVWAVHVAHKGKK